jgi:hypothetical protein
MRQSLLNLSPFSLTKLIFISYINFCPRGLLSSRGLIFPFDFPWEEYENKGAFESDREHFNSKWKFDPGIIYKDWSGKSITIERDDISLKDLTICATGLFGQILCPIGCNYF